MTDEERKEFEEFQKWKDEKKKEESLNPSLILNIFFHQFLWPLQLLTS